MNSEDDIVVSKADRPTYDELIAENASLRAEIALLKQRLGDIAVEASASSLSTEAEQISFEPTPCPYVHKHSTPDEKIELFMQLFTGRADVYAKRFVNKRTGKSGYAPVCGNEWVRGVCEKPKVKCSKCPNRSLLPFTKAVVDCHLRGKDPLGEDVIGVYPMLEDETCNFLVADFDDANWQEDVTVLRGTSLPRSVVYCSHLIIVQRKGEE